MPRIHNAALLIGLFLILGCSRTHVPLTLTEFSTLANALEEFPSADNVDLLNPDYTTFLRSRQEGYLKSIFRNLELRTSPKPAETFLEILKSSLAHRKQITQNQPHVLVIRPPTGSQFIVWGDLQGAFHSLLRDLNELRRRKVIDESLKIIQKDTFFVFNGNQIDRSPFNLEALSLIMALMNANEGKVIYLAGRHEIKEVWKDYNTWRELKAVFCDDELDMNCFPKEGKLLSSFFKTLPLSLYVLDSNMNDGHALKFYSHEGAIIDEEFDDIVRPSQDFESVPRVHLLSNESSSDHVPVSVDATVRAISRSISYRATNGLDMIEPEDGSISWTSLSSPVLSNRTLFDFHNDAFVQIKINSDISNSTISLIYQDAMTQKGFKQTNYHILSGQTLSDEQMKSPVKISNYQLPFGSTFDLSGVSSTLGQRTMSGVDLRFRKQNRGDDNKDHEPGIDGNLLRFYMKDDRSRPDLAQQNVQMLMNKHNVHTLILPAGIGTIEALTPQIESGSLTVFFPNSGAGALRTPKLKNLINLRTSFTNESCALVRYAKEFLRKDKFAIVYQNDDFGQESMKAAKTLLEKKYQAKDSDICAIPYEPNSLELDESAKKVKECNARTILLLATYSAAAAIIKKIGLQALSETAILGLSHITDALKDTSNLINEDSLSRKTGLQTVISRVVPNPQDKSLLVVKRYKEQMDKEYRGANHNPDSLEAYIGTSILMHSLKDLETPTRENLVKKFESLKDFDHQGLTLTFNPKTRELIDELWLDTGTPTWINLKSANTLCDVARDTQSIWPKR